MMLIGLAKKLESKMENISKKSNLSLLNNTVTSAATLHMGKSKPSNEDSTYAN